MAERCRGWDGDAARHGTVPLGLYAQAVHGVCGFVLSEDELCQLLCAVHPEQGEPPGGKLLCGRKPAPAVRQIKLGPVSSLGQPRPASASLGQPRPAPASLGQLAGVQAGRGHTGLAYHIGKLLREQPFDYNRFSRTVKVNAARSASAYIRRSSAVSPLE